jgi:hypothetical protein
MSIPPTIPLIDFTTQACHVHIILGDRSRTDCFCFSPEVGRLIYESFDRFQNALKENVTAFQKDGITQDGEGNWIAPENRVYLPGIVTHIMNSEEYAKQFKNFFDRYFTHEITRIKRDFDVKVDVTSNSQK